MIDSNKIHFVRMDDQFCLVVNPADGLPVEKQHFLKYFVNYINKHYNNDCITFIVSKKLYSILQDLNIWNYFLDKLCDKGYKKIQYYCEDLDSDGSTIPYLTLQFDYIIK